MIEDISVRTLQVLMLALREAGARGATAVDEQDLLVGLIIEDQGEAPRFLGSGLLSPDRALRHTAAEHSPLLTPSAAADFLARAERWAGHARQFAARPELPLSPAVGRLFEAARATRRELNRSQIDPVHLFAAIAGRTSSSTATTLSDLGLTGEKLRRALRGEPRNMSDGDAAYRNDADGARPRSRAGLVLLLARLHASNRGNAVVTLLDAVAALVIEDQGNAANHFPEAQFVTRLLGQTAEQAHRPFFSEQLAAALLAKLNQLAGASDRLDARQEGGSVSVGIDLEDPPPGGIVGPMLPMSEALHLAFTEAARIQQAVQQRELHPLHLLAAIVGHGENKSALILCEAGITREKVLEAIRGQAE